MTATRVATNFRVLAYDDTSIPQPNPQYYCVADDLSALVVPNQGTSAGAANTGFRSAGLANSPNTIAGQPLFNPPLSDPTLPALNELEFCLLNAAGERVYFGDQAVTMARAEANAGGGGGLFGVLLKVREVHADSVLVPAVSGDPTGSGGTPALGIFQWRVDSGTSWHTVTPQHGPPATRVMLRDPVAGQLASVTSITPIIRDQSFRADLDFAGSVNTGSGGFVAVPWCGAHRVIWRENDHPCYERWMSDESGFGYRTIRKFHELPTLQARGRAAQHWTFYARIIAGHLVLTFVTAGVTMSFDILDPQPVTTVQPGAPGSPIYRAQAATWPSGTVSLQSVGIRVSGGISLLQYAKTVSYDGVAGPLVGSFSRSVFTRRRPPGGTTVTSAPRQGGFTRPKGGGLTWLDSSWSENNYGGQVDYTCHLTGDSQAIDATSTELGVHSPFVTAVIARSSQSSTYLSGPSLDITRACVGDWDIDSAEPPSMVVGEMRLTVDRDLLTGLFTEAGWTPYVKQFNLVSFEVESVSIDTSTVPATRTVGSFDQLFIGYIFTPTDKWSGAQDSERTLVLRDHMQRTVAPAGFIGDDWDAPLDWLALGSGQPLCGGTCWREILRRTVGDWGADEMNGGTDTDRLYFPSSYPFMIDVFIDCVGLYDGVVPLKSAWLVPPKFGSDANGWGSDFDTMEYACRYYGLNPEGTNTSFIYGHLVTLYKAARAVGDSSGVNLYIPDADYIAGDVDKVAMDASRTQDSDMALNNFVGWQQRDELGSLSPAFINAHSRLPPEDPNSQEKTWPRTKLIEPKFNVWPNEMQALTDATMNEFRDRDPATGCITARGYALARLFMVIQLQLGGAHSDTTIGLNGIPLRVRRYGHKGNFESKDFQTLYYFRTLTHSGF